MRTPKVSVARVNAGDRVATIPQCFDECRESGGCLPPVRVVQMESGEIGAPVAQNDFKPAIGYERRRQVLGDVGQADAVYSRIDDVGHAVEDQLPFNLYGKRLAVLLE